MSELRYLIDDYHLVRKLKEPTTEQALMWAETELAEVYELLLSRIGGWVRNHPEHTPTWSPEAFAEELGDVIMMLVIAGKCEGVDPLDALKGKLLRTMI